MSFLQLTVHSKELEIEGIACSCSLFNPITSCGLWGQELNHCTHQPELSPFPGHTPQTWLSLPWAPTPALQELWFRQGFPLTPLATPCRVSTWTWWPQTVCQLSMRPAWVATSPAPRCCWRTVPRWVLGIPLGTWHLGTDASHISGDAGCAVHVAGPRCRWTSQTEMWKNVTVFCFPAW